MIELLLEHGTELLAGTTLILALGVLTGRARRQPLRAQRRAELALLAVLLFLPVALVPLERPGRALLDSFAAALRLGVDASSNTGSAAHNEARLAGFETATRDDTLRVGALGWPRPASTLPKTQESSPAEHGADPALLSASTSRAFPPQLAANRSRETNTTEAAGDPAGGVPLSTDTTPGAPQLARQGLGADALLGAGPPAPLVDPTALVIVFLLGAALCLARMALGLMRLRRLLTQALPAPRWIDTWLAEHAPGLAVGAVVVRDARRPFCVGLRRQTIVLPPALLRGSQRNALEPVLLHELAHARNGDGRGRLLCALAMPLLWFHPLFWILRRRIHDCSELLADDRAADDDRPRYARQLLDLATRLPRPDALPAGARSVFGNRREFTRRIEMLLHRKGRLDTRLGAATRGAHSLLLLLSLCVSASLFGAQPAAAQDADLLHTRLDAARAENEALRTELAELRESLRALTTELSSRALIETRLHERNDQQALIQDSHARAGLHEAMQLRELELALHTECDDDCADGRKHEGALGAAKAELAAVARIHEHAQHVARTKAELAAVEATQAAVKTEQLGVSHAAKITAAMAAGHRAATAAEHERAWAIAVREDPANSTVATAPRGRVSFKDPYARERAVVNSTSAPRAAAGGSVSSIEPRPPLLASAPVPQIALEPTPPLAPLPPLSTSVLEMGRELFGLRSERDRAQVERTRLAPLVEAQIVPVEDLHQLDRRIEQIWDEMEFLELVGHSELRTVERELMSTQQLLDSWVVPDGAEGNQARLQRHELQNQTRRLESQLELLSRLF